MSSRLTVPVQWVVPEERLPDSDRTVLVHTARAAEPVWPGYYNEEEGWMWANGDSIDEEVDGEVLLWAEFPAIPEPNLPERTPENF